MKNFAKKAFDATGIFFDAAYKTAIFVTAVGFLTLGYSITVPAIENMFKEDYVGILEYCEISSQDKSAVIYMQFDADDGFKVIVNDLGGNQEVLFSSDYLFEAEHVYYNLCPDEEPKVKIEAAFFAFNFDY